MVWFKRNTIRRLIEFYNQYSRRPVSVRSDGTNSRNHRRNLDHRRHYHQYHYYILVCLLAVAPAYAEEPTVSNNANPVAAATGNVTNQAVQFQNNGAPSRQYFHGSNSCNGSTMTFSPFYMGNDTTPMNQDGYVKSNNWGAQVNFSVPLDGGMIELCKQIARRHAEKMRLDYELIRAQKCTEIMKAGFTFRPFSRVEHLCSDIVPIVSIQNVRSFNQRSYSRDSRSSGAQ